jgi:hypothetical protein
LFHTVRLDGCYSLEQIDFLDTHPLASSLPKYHKDSKFELKAQTAVFGPRAKAAILSNPRAVCDSLEEDDDYGGYGGGSGAGGLGSMAQFEALFAQMHKNGF